MPKQQQKRKLNKPCLKKNKSAKITAYDDYLNFNQYEEDTSNRILSNLEPLIIPSFETKADTGVYTFPLPTNDNWIVFDACSHFAVEASFRKQTQDNTGKWVNSWVMTDDSDKANIKLNTNFLAKMFKDVEYLRDQIPTKINRSRDNVDRILETFFLTYTTEDVRKRLFGGLMELSSSNTVNLKKLPEPEEKKQIDLFVAKKFTANFVPFFSFPFARQVNEDGTALKPIIIPSVKNIKSSIKLICNRNGNNSFYQDANNATIKYKLYIDRVSLVVKKQRFSDGLPFNTDPKCILKLNPTQNNLKYFYPTHSVFTERIEEGRAFLKKSIEGVPLPNYILIFNLEEMALNGGSVVDNASTSHDSFQKLNLSTVDVKFNGNSFYSNDNLNCFTTNNTIMNYINVVQRHMHTFANIPWTDKLNYELLSDSELIMPHQFINLELDGNSKKKKLPLHTKSHQVNERGTLDIALNFKNDQNEKAIAGIILYVLLYETKNPEISLENGSISNQGI